MSFPEVLLTIFLYRLGEDLWVAFKDGWNRSPEGE